MWARTTASNLKDNNKDYIVLLLYKIDFIIFRLCDATIAGHYCIVESFMSTSLTENLKISVISVMKCIVHIIV